MVHIFYTWLWSWWWWWTLKKGSNFTRLIHIKSSSDVSNQKSRCFFFQQKKNILFLILLLLFSFTNCPVFTLFVFDYNSIWIQKLIKWLIDWLKVRVIWVWFGRSIDIDRNILFPFHFVQMATFFLDMINESFCSTFVF